MGDSKFSGELTDDQKIRLHLAGAVPIPQPFPELGEIVPLNGSASARARPAGKSPSKEDAALVQVTHIRPRYRLIRYTVRLGDVAAIYLPGDDRIVDLSREDQWRIGPEISAAFGKLGIAFVYEHAQVLLQSETGVTASEVAAYVDLTAWCPCDPCCAW